jgi:hypothetical protein
MSDTLTLFSTREWFFIYSWFKGNTQGLYLGLASNYVRKTYAMQLPRNLHLCDTLQKSGRYS